MPRIALLGYLVFAALAFGWRSWIHWRRTGSTGYRGVAGRVGSLEWLGGVLFVGAMAATPLAAVLQELGLVTPLAQLAPGTTLVLAGALYAVGLGGTLWSQLAMGDSWRIGVDTAERTTLVANGPFRLVRNPIYTSMVAGMGGLALLTPNVIAAAAVGLLLIALELQVRAVEEPHLLRTHGPAYRSYAARTGRFLPGVGRLDGAAA